MRTRRLLRKLNSPLPIWPRFSLMTMFLVAIFLSLVFSNLYTSWQLGKTHDENRVQKSTLKAQEEELRLYRHQLGILAIKDPAMVHIIALETNQNMVWKYRVFVPDAKSFAVKSVVGQVAAVDFPPDKADNTIGPGEWILTFSLTQRADGKWVERIDRVSDSMIYEHFANIHDSAINWQKVCLAGERQVLAPVDGQKSFDGDSPINLVRIRDVHDIRPRKQDADGPTTGLIFWLEPK